MLKTYCPSCGHPNTYISAKPKFCANCGKPVNASAPTTYATRPSNKADFNNSEDNEYRHLDPQNDDFVFEADDIVADKTNTISLGALGAQKKTGYQRVDPVNAPDKKQFIKQFSAQAGNSNTVTEINE